MSVAGLAPLLERFQRGFDAAARLSADPVEFPRRHVDPADAEVAGLVAACLAYGRADVFKGKIAEVLSAGGASPAAFADRLARHPDPGAFPGFRYRFNTGEDLAALLAAAGWVRGLHGSLGARFAALLREAGRAADGRRTDGRGSAGRRTDGRRTDGRGSAGRATDLGPALPLRTALTAFATELREAPPARIILAERGGRGMRHLCPDPAAGGAAKRWNLYLRWMVRGPDGVDLGIWRDVPTSALVVPLDTHVARVAWRLGLTRRRDLSWRTAEEVTAALRTVDPGDPVRFDFALCHLGMSGGCPPRRSVELCDACALRDGCRAARQRRPAVSAGRPADRDSRSARTGRS